MAELEPRIEKPPRAASQTAPLNIRVCRMISRVLLLDWYGYHWHRAQIELNETRDRVREQEIHVNEAREVYAKVQAEYVTFRERLSGLRAQLNVWHRKVI